MNLDHLDGRKKPGLDIDRVDATVAATLARLPDGHRRLLALSDGIELSSGALIYGSVDLVERNRTYEVADYLPDHVAIGDDGGGQLFLVREGSNSPVLRVGMGAIGSIAPVVLAETIEAWVEQGCPVQSAADLAETATPDFADVLLVAIPGGKLTNLIAVKTELGLGVSIAELKALAAKLPACLMKNAPYGKFRKRCDTLNARFGHCLSLHWS